MSKTPVVYLIGGGPGDPELVTLKAVRCLARADLVLYDALVHPDLLKHCRPDAERVFVGKRAGRQYERQAEINQRLIAGARAGRVVARLKGGDPYLFGRGSEEAEALVAEGIAFEVVPGVPSPSAAAAYAGMSLTHRELSSSVAYLTATESATKDASAHDWAKLATATQTLVIFMGVRKLAGLMQLLIANGRSADCPAAVIQSASTPQQRTVVGTVGDIAAKAEAAKLGMPALTIVGDIVRLRDQLRWFDTKPLFGKRVLVTRAAEQSDSLAQALRERGAHAIELPMIRIEPPDDPAPLTAAVASLSSYDWLVFTSQNGVRAFFRELTRQGFDSRALAGLRIAAIGPSTADVLAPYGVRCDVMPDTYRGEALAERMLQAQAGPMQGVRVLLPRAAVARDVLPQTLTDAGAIVDVVEAYRTYGASPETAAELRRMLDAGELDVVTFTASSTVQHTLAAVGPDAAQRLRGLTLASIGPITTDTAKAQGLEVTLTADEYTMAGLVAALEQHYQ
ncbi:MAG: uroporphyrinogen-III C-methyltransferase [Polyangiales bacterium]